jgi:hypothetical protein
MTNEERQQAIEWLKRRPVMMSGAKRMYDLAVEALEAYVPDMNVGKTEPSRESDTEITRCSDDTISRRAAIEATYDLIMVQYYDGDPEKDEKIILQTKEVIRDRIKDLPAAQPKRGKWIPVSERLPEEEGHYLVTDDSGGEKWVDSSMFIRCDDGSVYWDFVNVTAWMPLPGPWKGEG